MLNLVPKPPRRYGPPPPPVTQAERIFAKFGGASKLCKALAQLADKSAHRCVSAVYRWNMPKANGGSNGLIPTSALADVLAAARLQGIVITPEDLFPAKGPIHE